MDRKEVQKMIIGIDPGAKGGVACIIPYNRAMTDTDIFIATAMPMKEPVKGRKPTVDVCALSRILRGGEGEGWATDMVYLENVHAMPRQGVSSTFQFGRTFGAIEAAIEMSRCQVTYVEPRVWKKHFGLKGNNKNASVEKATELYGDDHWPTGPRGGQPHEGVAEAALIATYGLETRERG